MTKEEWMALGVDKVKVRIAYSPPPPVAEQLLSILETLYSFPGVVVQVDKDDLPVIDMAIARIKLAQTFQQRGPAFVFRALMEEWDPFQMNREVY